MKPSYVHQIMAHEWEKIGQIGNKINRIWLKNCKKGRRKNKTKNKWPKQKLTKNKMEMVKNNNILKTNRKKKEQTKIYQKP